MRDGKGEMEYIGTLENFGDDGWISITLILMMVLQVYT